MKKAITLFTICLLIITKTQTTQAQTPSAALQWLQENGNNNCHIAFKNKFDFSFNYEYVFLSDAVIETLSGDFKTETKIYYKDLLYTDDVSTLEVTEFEDYKPPVTMIKIPIQKKYRLLGKEQTEQLSEETGFYLSYETNKENAKENMYKMLEELMLQAKLNGAELYNDEE